MCGCHTDSPVQSPVLSGITLCLDRKHSLNARLSRLILIAALLLSAVLPAKAQMSINRPEIWFSPKQQSLNTEGPGIVFNKYDFPTMVASDDGWQQAASHVAAMQINAVGIVEAYHDVQSVISMINRHNFKIIVSGSVVYTNHECSVRSEGVTNDEGFEREFVLQMRHWARVGGRTDYITMDSPLVFGYYVTQKECHFSVEEVARRAATTVNMVLQEFPAARIVDAEGPAWLPPKSWWPDYDKFLRTFNSVSKRPIEYLSLDMHWTDDWHTGYRWVTATREIADYAHAHGLKVGLIFNADPRHIQSADGETVSDKPMTDALWMQAVRDHMKLAHEKRLPLDFVSLNSWVKFPLRNLPESDRAAYTSLVNYAYDLWSH